MTQKKINPKKLEDKKSQIIRSPEIMNAAAMKPYLDEELGDTSLISIVKALKENIADINSGDLKSVEAALFSQSNVLQTVFVNLVQKASTQTHINQFSSLMNLALKAQNQSRASMQALVEMKNPKRVAFVKQTNIASGHQQVNNINATNSGKDLQNEPNKLMDTRNEQWLDTRAKSETSKTN